MACIDTEWFRCQLEDLVCRWLQFAPTQDGFLRCDADRSWKSRGENVATIVSQTRLLFNFAAALKLARIGAISVDTAAVQDAGAKGLRFLIRHFLDNAGGWFWSVGSDGGVREDTKDTYGHAFAIFALSWASRYIAVDEANRQEAASLAQQTWQTVRLQFADTEGGFIRRRDRFFQKDLDKERSQNPLMHMFEALIVARELMGAEWAKEALSTLYQFVFGRLYQPASGCIPEVYDKKWQPLVTPPGRTELGHQFEWAYLLTEYTGSVPPEAIRLLFYGLNHGLNPETGAIRSNLHSPADAPLAWWTQTEALRAMYRLEHRSNGRLGLAQNIAKLSHFMKCHMVDPEYGGWYTSLYPDGRVQTSDKGSVWKLDYHTIAMCAELIASGQ